MPDFFLTKFTHFMSCFVRYISYLQQRTASRVMTNKSRRTLPAVHVGVVGVRPAIRNCHDWNTLFSQLTLAQRQTTSYTIKIRPQE